MRWRLVRPGAGHAKTVEREPSPGDHRDDDRPRRPDEPMSAEEQQARERAAAERNPDPVTRREALELDLMDDDRSEAGEDIGDEID